MSRQAFVYVGPNRPFGLPLMRNAVLAGQPEAVMPQLAPYFEKHRQFRRLFVPASELAAARAAMRNPASALAIFSAEIAAESVKEG